MTVQIIKAIEDSDIQKCFEVRFKVFCDEQGVDKSVEIDEFDATCHHWVATLESKPVGVIRLVMVQTSHYHTSHQSELIGKIGRLAVLDEYRGKGIAKKLMVECEQFIKENDKSVQRIVLHAQEDKQEFYKRLGYKRVDDKEEPFDEDGILHVKMIKEI